MTTTAPPGVTAHPMWLPDSAVRGFAGFGVAVLGDHPLLDTLRAELADGAVDDTAAEQADLLFVPADQAAAHLDPDAVDVAADLGDEGFALIGTNGRIVAVYGGGNGALYAWFHLVRLRAANPGAAIGDLLPQAVRQVPATALRMLDHWDNVAIHHKMGQVERGYSGGSIFYEDGALRDDLSRVRQYARFLASIGINRVSINNVNVHALEASMLTERLDWVVALADCFRPWGIKTHLSVSFASPKTLAGLDTSDPLDPDVIAFWQEAARGVYQAIPDFGGFVVKADSEGQPGPFAYGRTHADGANLLARAIAPFGGLVHWRAFVYNHRQDWRDRKTDRARAAYDHFAPLDGQFDDNVIVQVKQGPMDFQPREPISPVLSAMPHTKLAVELQVTQEYTGQQLHAVYLGPAWHEILTYQPLDDGRILADFVRGGIAAVANVGDSPFWTGHPLAQANLYAYGRLCWDPSADPIAILDEWISLTFGNDPHVRTALHSILDGSWRTYEDYTTPLGVGFMVTPHYHYDPSVDGYEYSPWGTYHFADRDGVGVDRSVATGTGYAGQYAEPWRSTFEHLQTCPDELLLFFHHVPYTHRLHSGTTVIQHIYDTHFGGHEQALAAQDIWRGLEGVVDEAVYAEGLTRFAEQVRSATEWRDQVNTYFYRASGIADEQARQIF